MAINESHKANFNTLLAAVRNGDVVLVECSDAKSGFPVITVCAVARNAEEFAVVPLAKLFDGNPYEELAPPELEGVGA